MSSSTTEYSSCPARSEKKESSIRNISRTVILVMDSMPKYPPGAAPVRFTWRGHDWLDDWLGGRAPLTYSYTCSLAGRRIRLATYTNAQCVCTVLVHWLAPAAVFGRSSPSRQAANRTQEVPQARCATFAGAPVGNSKLAVEKRINNREKRSGRIALAKSFTSAISACGYLP